MNSSESSEHEIICTVASARAPGMRLICPAIATHHGTRSADAAIVITNITLIRVGCAL